MIEGELLISKGGYLSKRNFTFYDSDLQYEVQTSYPDTEWSYARSRISNRNKISKSAIALAKRIKAELDIEVFPLIETIAIKGYKQDGQFKFRMPTKKEMEYYYFDCPAAWYKVKKNKLEWDVYLGDNLITIAQSQNE